MEVQPVTLAGSIVRLEPLSEGHVAGLTHAGGDEAIWRYMPYGLIRTEEQMREFVREALARQGRGTDLPFAVVHLQSGRVIGCTRYLAIEPPHRALEIGGTWYAPEFQRTGVNTECKYLLLRHAFDELGCVRVQLKTDLRNERSQKAIARLGAVREGILRKSMILPDGYHRSTVVYSIVDHEWAAAKERLERMLARC